MTMRIGCKSFVLLSLLSTCAIVFSQKATIREELISLNTYMFSDPNPVPDISRIYPYFRFQGYTNKAEMKNWKMVVLENDYIKVLVCPAIGGKVWAAIEKSTGKEFLYFNHTAKFRDVAMRGAWTSGGLEYNFGDIGHIPTCATPVDYTLKNNPDGSVSCVVGAEDLPSHTRWNVEVVVYKDKAFFETKVRWLNNTSLPCTYYHWMNAAAKASDDLEFIYPGNKRIGHGGEIGEWPIENGRDLSFYKNNNFGSYKSYHVMNSYADFFGGYWHKSDFGFGHWGNYDDKPGKKLWIWGLAPEGMIWKDLLTDSDGQYIEFQAGKLFNQAAFSSTTTPFKHREFSPHDADIMDEIWFPLKGTKGMVAASKYAVLNVEKENGKTVVYLSALQQLSEQLTVVSQGKTIYSEKINLQPLELSTIKLDIPSNEKFTVELGSRLLCYSSNPTEILVDRPVKPNPSVDFTTAYGLYVKALEMEKQRLNTDALLTYEKSLEIEPAFTPSLNRLGLAYLRRGDAEKALEYLQGSLAVDTYDDEANYLYGLVNWKLKNSSEAKSGFSIAAASVKYRSAAYTELAAVFLAEKDYFKSKEYALKAINFNAYNLSAYEILAITARKTNNDKEALAIQKKLSELDANNPFYSFEAYLTDKSTPKLNTFKAGIRNELPHETYLSLALRYHELACDDEALAVLHQAPTNAEIVLWQAGLDKLNRAALLQQALEMSPAMVFPSRLETAQLLEELLKEKEHWKLHYYLGLIYWNLGMLENTKAQFMGCRNEPDYAPFYLAKANLYASDKAMVDACLQKARSLAPNDWRTTMAQIRFDLDNQQPENARQLSQKMLKKYPEKGELGLYYAQSLIQLKLYKEAVAFLETFNVLPCEGATAGRALYHEACIRAAMNALVTKNYSKAVNYAQKTKLWPVNLGVGKPYDVDERLDNYIISLANEKLAKPAESAHYFTLIADYKNPLGAEENSKLLLQVLVLQKTGRSQEASTLLKDYLMKYPENKYLKWVEAKFTHAATANDIEQSILKESTFIQPYDVVFIDKEFSLVVDFMKCIESQK